MTTILIAFLFKMGASPGADSAGLEFATDVNRLHFTAGENRAHFSVNMNRLHFIAGENRAHFSTDDNRLHYKVKEED